MDGTGGESTDISDSAPAPPVALAKWRNELARAFQFYLDRSAPHTLRRWLATLAVATIYALRVYFVKGFYVISYGVATYLLNMFIGFLSPKLDPELEALDGASFPAKDSDEFKPFIRRLPEFRLWYSITKAFIVAFILTFISVLDVPVFWPILLSYWLFLFFLTMKRQIVHMIKYNYNPVTGGKLRQDSKKSTSTSGTASTGSTASTGGTASTSGTVSTGGSASTSGTASTSGARKKKSR